MIVVSSLYIDLFYQLKEQRIELEKQGEKFESLKRKYDQLAGLPDLVNLSLERPLLHKTPGVYIVSGYHLKYVRTGIGPGYYERGQEAVVLYSPQDNLTLTMQLWYLLPFPLHLTIQEGNAFLNESARSRAIQVGNHTHWQTPIVWSINATEAGVYEAQLPTKGWYTLSMAGTIRTSDGAITSRMIGAWYNETWHLTESVNLWIDFKLLKGGEPVLFAVRPNR